MYILPPTLRHARMPVHSSRTARFPISSSACFEPSHRVVQIWFSRRQFVIPGAVTPSSSGKWEWARDGAARADGGVRAWPISSPSPGVLYTRPRCGVVRTHPSFFSALRAPSEGLSYIVADTWGGPAARGRSSKHPRGGAGRGAVEIRISHPRGLVERASGFKASAGWMGGASAERRCCGFAGLWPSECGWHVLYALGGVTCGLACGIAASSLPGPFPHRPPAPLRYYFGSSVVSLSRGAVVSSLTAASPEAIAPPPTWSSRPSPASSPVVPRWVIIVIRRSREPRGTVACRPARIAARGNGIVASGQPWGLGCDRGQMKGAPRVGVGMLWVKVSGAQGRTRCTHWNGFAISSRWRCGCVSSVSERRARSASGNGSPRFHTRLGYSSKGGHSRGVSDLGVAFAHHRSIGDDDGEIASRCLGGKLGRGLRKGRMRLERSCGSPAAATPRRNAAK
ncbi:hypothetical protein BD779DRAFT_1479340 [Infundibulicybe gibba]|nr:hypothetical protein BD779DRAFT_1479340 [Infundibulicybe gibba]